MFKAGRAASEALVPTLASVSRRAAAVEAVAAVGTARNVTVHVQAPYQPAQLAEALTKFDARVTAEGIDRRLREMKRYVKPSDVRLETNRRKKYYMAKKEVDNEFFRLLKDNPYHKF